MDSWRRQQIWGTWADGAWTGEEVPLDLTMLLPEAHYNGCDALIAARP